MADGHLDELMSWGVIGDRRPIVRLPRLASALRWLRARRAGPVICYADRVLERHVPLRLNRVLSQWFERV
jgi:hypothetical protein